MIVSARLKNAPELPATRTVLMPAFSYSARILSENGVIGSSSAETILCISASRTIKFVAQVSSSISSVLDPHSIASTTEAA